MPAVLQSVVDAAKRCATSCGRSMQVQNSFMLGMALTSVLLMTATASSVERSAPTPLAARESQWLYREHSTGDERQSIAIFLSWDYSGVIFTVSCDRRNREFVLDYHLRPEWEDAASSPIALGSGEQFVSLITKREGYMLRARTRITPQLRALLTNDDDIEILASNDMEEPWHVGRAEPLRRVALDCE